VTSGTVAGISTIDLGLGTVAKEETAGAAADAIAPPKGRSKKLLLIVVAAFVLVLAGAGTYFFVFAKKKEAVPAEAPQPAKTFVYYNLPEFVVNLPASTGRTSFLKLALSLELDSAADVASVQAVMPRVVDYLQTYLRELRPDDLRGTAALSRLRQELLLRVSAAAPLAKVNDVLLQELLLQ
jgi:flagellar FliL protein